MRSLAICCAALALLLAGCAQVPKEAVELSNTVGRDIKEVHDAHLATAEVLFARMRADVNAFIDDVYVPFLFGRWLKTTSGRQLLDALTAVAASDENTDEGKEARTEALRLFETSVKGIRNNIENKRNGMLSKIDAQEKEIVDAINASYVQLHYANSIVSGHLASIVKVHEEQDYLLSKVGLAGLRTQVGEKLAATSESLGELVIEANEKKDEAGEFLDKIESLLGVSDDAEPAGGGGS